MMQRGEVLDTALIRRLPPENTFLYLLYIRCAIWRCSRVTAEDLAYHQKGLLSLRGKQARFVGLVKIDHYATVAIRRPVAAGAVASVMTYVKRLVPLWNGGLGRRQIFVWIEHDAGAEKVFVHISINLAVLAVGCRGEQNKGGY